MAPLERDGSATFPGHRRCPPRSSGPKPPPATLRSTSRALRRSSNSCSPPGWSTSCTCRPARAARLGARLFDGDLPPAFELERVRVADSRDITPPERPPTDPPNRSIVNDTSTPTKPVVS